MDIPLDIVKKEWSKAKGMKEITFLAKYYGIYRDIFGGEEFKPLVWLDITFDSNPVHRGNILEPAKVSFSSYSTKHNSSDLLTTYLLCYNLSLLSKNAKSMGGSMILFHMHLNDIFIANFCYQLVLASFYFQCLKRPAVHFTSALDKYHTLMMLNPEGCWPCANAEVLHWML